MHAAPDAPPALADLPAVLKVPEVARFLRVDKSTVYALVDRGELPVVKIGRSFRVTRDQLGRFLAGQDAGTTELRAAEPA
jgi:excisionase family DNA binding protein